MNRRTLAHLRRSPGEPVIRSENLARHAAGWQHLTAFFGNIFAAPRLPPPEDDFRFDAVQRISISKRTPPITDTTRDIQTLAASADSPTSVPDAQRLPRLWLARAALIFAAAHLVLAGLDFGGSINHVARFVLGPLVILLGITSLVGLARLLWNLALARTSIGNRLRTWQALRHEERVRWEQARASRAAYGNHWIPWRLAASWVAISSLGRARQQAARRAASARGAIDPRESVQEFRFDRFFD